MISLLLCFKISNYGMKFGIYGNVIILPVMKKILLLMAVAMIAASCTTSKKASADKGEGKKDKKLAEQDVIKKAVESRRYIIKVNRIYAPSGGFRDLVPRYNYIIVDGEIASVSLAYLGGSYGVRPITGINFHGHTVKYEMVNNQSNGKINVNMKVAKDSDTFDFYITIQPSGYCSVSLNNLYLQSVNYKGELVPVAVQKSN
jgi:uncharacterized membrane protein